jgi:phosphohistidine phosphatase SixA
MRLFLRHLLLCALLMSVQYPAHADPVADAIRQGGVALLMRHATAPGLGDPEGFKLDDCSTQRNLSDQGRAEARRIGAHLKKLGLPPGDVLSSQWCRCRETASLAFGSYQDWPMLNSFFSDRGTEPKQKAAVLNRISQIKAGQRPLVLVTHQVIVTSVTGIFPQSGEVVVVAPQRADGKTTVRVIGTIKPDAATP